MTQYLRKWYQTVFKLLAKGANYDAKGFISFWPGSSQSRFVEMNTWIWKTEQIVNKCSSEISA
jgi:hypothetical protein